MTSTAAPVDDTWQHRAACRTEDPELFFAFDRAGIAEAETICRDRCPVRNECLAGALARREPHGVWGGHEFHQGKIRDEAAGPRGTCLACQGPAATEQARYCDPCRPSTYTPKPINHGTEGGAKAHRRRNQQPCPNCAEAERTAWALRVARPNPTPCAGGCGQTAYRRARYCDDCRTRRKSAIATATNQARKAA